jgi:hypothetical protein
MPKSAELVDYLPQDHVITGIDQDPDDLLLLWFHFACGDSKKLTMAREYSQEEIDQMIWGTYRFFYDEANEKTWILKLDHNERK